MAYIYTYIEILQWKYDHEFILIHQPEKVRPFGDDSPNPTIIPVMSRREVAVIYPGRRTIRGKNGFEFIENSQKMISLENPEILSVSISKEQGFVPRKLNQIYRIHPYTPRWDGFMVKHSMPK
jgi:hypothetical protein